MRARLAPLEPMKEIDMMLVRFTIFVFLLFSLISCGKRFVTSGEISAGKDLVLANCDGGLDVREGKIRAGRDVTLVGKTDVKLPEKLRVPRSGKIIQGSECSEFDLTFLGTDLRG